MAELPFNGISTYIQSGNIIFNTDLTDQNLLAKMIADKIQQTFNFHVPVTIATSDELRSVVAKNPFAKETQADDKQPYVYFCASAPSEENIAAFRNIDFQNDRFVISGRHIFVHYATGAGTTKLTLAVIEKKLQVLATARNWKTVNKLLTLTAIQ